MIDLLTAHTPALQNLGLILATALVSVTALLELTARDRAHAARAMSDDTAAPGTNNTPAR